MNYAIFNSVTREVHSLVTAPTGALPPGCVFLPEPELPGDAVPAAVTAPVPETVPLWALREVCATTVRAGRSVSLKAEIDAAIQSLPEPQRTLAANRWEYKDTLRRADPIIAALVAGLGLPEAEVNDLFRAAAVLN